MTEQSWLPEDVRQRAADALRLRHDALVADLDVLIGASLPEPPAGDLRARLVNRTIELLGVALSGDALAENPAVAEFARMERAGLKPQDLFAAVRLAERSVLHELSVDADLGATSDDWPAITIIVRRASFDLLAMLYERAAAVPRDVTDPVTKLMSRAVFEIAVAKELQRSVRHHQPVSLVLLEVDNLDAINRRDGYGVGDLLMERLGVLMQRYFREPDWVARYCADSIAVLLPETGALDARTLAEGARQVIEERLVFPDRDERRVRVTASVSVVTVELRGKSGEDREALDTVQVMTEAEAGVKRARARGGNTIECVAVTRDSLSVDEAAACLHCAPGTVRRLIAAGTLPAVESGGRMRIDRIALEAYGKRQARPHRK
jgi:diguanylate cyclase (GGDEF)-like protein/excisionase family DNA binding protein